MSALDNQRLSFRDCLLKLGPSHSRIYSRTQRLGNVQCIEGVFTLSSVCALSTKVISKERIRKSFSLNTVSSFQNLRSISFLY